MGKTININLANILPNWDLSVAFYANMDDPQIKFDQALLAKLAKEVSLSSIRAVKIFSQGVSLQ